MQAPGNRPTRRGFLIGGAALAVVGPGAVYAATTASAATGPQLVWSADPVTMGLSAFAGIENHPETDPGVMHIFADKTPPQYRWVMHAKDRAGSDRQRQEVRGMHGVSMAKGDTFSYQYEMFIPSTLKGTTSFTHIFQIKQTGVADPLVTMNLTRSGSLEQLNTQLFSGGGALPGTNLAPLRNTWIGVRIDVTANSGSAGRLHYTITNNGQTVIDAARNGNCWTRGNEAHPKWGIYRSIHDSAQIIDTYLLIRNLRAYKL